MQNLPHNGVTVRFNGRLSFNKCPQAITDNFFVPTKLQPVPEVPVKNTQPKVKPYNQNNGNAYLQYILRKAKMAASNQQGYEQANGLTSSTKKTNN